MNAPTEDNDPFKPDAAAFRRVLYRIIWLPGAAIIAYAALLFFVPRPLKHVVSLSGMLVLCFSLLGLVWWLAQHNPSLNQLRPAGRRLVARIVSPIMLYIAVFAAVTWYDRAIHPTGMAAALMALASTAPFLVAIRAVMLFLKEETDEFLRARMLEGWAIATGLTLAVCTVWGFLDQLEVVPHQPLWAAFPIWLVCLFPAQRLVNREQ
jgi:hypothetical protein